MKTYPIPLAGLAMLADAIALLDWIKNRVPDDIPEKAEAAIKAPLCHELIETLLGDDAASVYGPVCHEKETHA